MKTYKNLFVVLLIIFGISITTIAKEKNRFLEEFRNKDGSYGESNKEILTSLVMLAHFAHGETNHSKNYGDIVQGGINYLTKEIDKINYNSINLKHAYMLWALAESYSVSKDEKVAKAIDKMAVKIIPLIKKHYISEENILIYNVLSNAFYTGKSLKSLKIKEIKPFFDELTEIIWPLRLSTEDRSYLLQIATLWNLVLTKNYDLPDPKIVFDDVKNHPCSLFSFTHVYFSSRDNKWKVWNKLMQVQLLSMQNFHHRIWDDKSLKNPEILKIKGNDKVIFNSCYSVLNLTLSYRGLVLSNKKNW